ncbi:MAG: ABC transporter substrate-binding protein, partial [Caldilineaceae bacterium]
MSITKSRIMRATVLLCILSLLLACAAPAAAPGQSTAAEPAAAESGGVARKDILVLPSNVNIPAPDIWNPYIPGTFILQGMNQNMMEPLFMLNYETGAIDGWLAESYEANETLDEWIVKLKPGTEWSDGTPLTSEDVVFTINLLKEYAPQLNWSGAVAQWVESVEAVDDRTIKFTLTSGNPRFVMENLAGTTSQAIVPLPKHVWDGKDPVTFKNEYNAETGSPVFSGPYVVKSFSSTEFIYKRNDNWWGAKSGAFNLPAPLEIHRPWVADAATAQQMLANNEIDAGGWNLSTNQLLMTQNDKLIVEAQVSLMDIDRVKVGQTAEVRFSAFKSRETPKMEGRLIGLSADKLVDESKPDKPSYYLARVEVTAEGVKDLARHHLDLVPGMPAEVLINTGNRTLLQYIT